MEQALKGFKADGVHYHLIRMFGVVAFSLALSGFMALGFQNENDQKAYLFGRVVVRTDKFVFVHGFSVALLRYNWIMEK